MRQETFFSTDEMSPEKWAYVVEYRTGFNFWHTIDDLQREPSHFRSEAGAEAAMDAMNVEHQRKVDLGVIEFRVVPKFIGYVPDEDETWIRP